MKNKTKFTKLVYCDYLNMLEELQLNWFIAHEARIGTRHSFYTSKNF